MNKAQCRDIFTEAANDMAQALYPDSYAQAWVNDDAWDREDEALITGESEIRIGMVDLMALVEQGGKLGRAAHALDMAGVPECEIRFTLYSRFDADGIENGITVFIEPESEMEFRQEVLDFVLEESRLEASADAAEYETSLRDLLLDFEEAISPLQDQDTYPSP